MKNVIYLQYSECSPLQKLQQSSKMLTLAIFKNQMKLSKQQSTQTGQSNYVCFPLQNRKKAWFFRIFFQNFPGYVGAL